MIIARDFADVSLDWSAQLLASIHSLLSPKDGAEWILQDERFEKK